MTDQQRHDEKVNKPDTESSVQERIAAQKKRAVQLMVEHKGIIKYVCEALNISRTTFYEWRNTDAQFAQDCIDAQEAAIDHVEHKLHKLINKGDTTAILFFMRCRAKQRGYVERQEIAPVNPDGSALSTTQINVNVLYPEGYVPPPGEAPVVTVNQDQQQ